MELRFIQSPALSSIPRSNLIEKPFVHTQFLRSFNEKRYPHSRNLKFVHFKVKASGTTKLGSQAVEKSPKDDGVKDGNIVFVAGATGKVGSRTVRELLKLGFKVRAGVRSVQRAEPLVKSVKQMKLGEAATPAVEMLELVECDLEQKEQIGPALSNSSIVICCIGASEKEVLDITGPFRIDYQATKNLIDAATVAKVKHFILLTSLGTNKVGFPAAILNLFWGVLIWKRKAEEALLASGIPYTIVRPGGMERPTDSYKETHNITLSLEDTLFGGQVSNLQVAELLAVMAKNLDLSYCKVVEVIAETTAPLTPMEELLTKIPPQRAGAPPKEPVVADKPEPVSKSITSESLSTSSEIESVAIKPTPSRPSSPYFAYEDLKPPVSPTPKTPSGSKEVSAIETKPESVSVVSVINSSPPTIADSAEPEPSAAEVQISRPLSPYAAYEDLKPPVSPTPKAPGGKEVIITETVPKPALADSEASGSTTIIATTEPEVAPRGVEKPTFLSPYAAYDDLKPPTSPSPSPPSTSIPPTAPTDNGGLSSGQTAAKSRPLSPFPTYDDLKPPTSPSPSTPSISIPPTVPTDNGGLSSTQTAAKSRPLSPFPTYEDLKPPTSPTPSSP